MLGTVYSPRKRDYFAFRTSNKLASNEAFSNNIHGVPKAVTSAVSYKHTFFVDRLEKVNVTPANIKESEFPIEKLPSPVWNFLLLHIPTSELLPILQVSKKWNKLASNEGHWKERSMRELEWLGDVEKKFLERNSEGKELTWKKFYEESGWRMHIYEMTGYGNETTFKFVATVFVPPHSSVDKFIDMVNRVTPYPITSAYMLLPLDYMRMKYDIPFKDRPIPQDVWSYDYNDHVEGVRPFFSLSSFVNSNFLKKKKEWAL